MQNDRSRESLLFLTDEELRQGIEGMFFAYRGFTADPDRILEKYKYGRAHHRALHFINRVPGTNVNNLLSILGVTKQSLNRVLRKIMYYLKVIKIRAQYISRGIKFRAL